MLSKNMRYWGNILDSYTIKNTTNTDIIKAEFGMLTCENSMKLDAIQPQKNVFNFANADAVVRFAAQNGMRMRGYTIIWPSALPSWISSITNSTQMTTAIQTHINTLLAHYRGKIYAWDVANEIFNEDGSLKRSIYYSLYGGDGFVDVAFKAARAADPNAKLYINDYNLDSATYSKTIGLVNAVKRWKAAGIPIDGIGSQCHLYSAGQGSGVQDALTLLATADVEVAITELDVVGANPADYASVTKACINVPQCVGITMWGVLDRDSWRSASSPLMFDSNGQKKPAYYAAYNALA
ncbi:hypothetical protein HK098_002965 [Nowakowskiella sp. JEL0407]|nr:hypothetical protein HK098_002965 [Nowakowskiella sp. JEL0407]